MMLRNVNAWKTIAVILIAALAGSGCDERLRKKFIRQKDPNKAQEEMDVVFQPVEYSSDYFDPAQQYEHHFHLWKAWHTDLKYALENRESLKRKKYLLEHEIEALRSMQYWLEPEKHADFDEMFVLLMKVDAELKKPELMQSAHQMLRQLEIVQSKIQGEYDLGSVRNHLIPAQ